MVDLNNIQNLVQVLQMLSSGDTTTIKKAEKMLKPFLKQPSSAVHLISILGGHSDVSCRHHAALLLKKKIGTFYPKYNQQQQTELRNGLISLLRNEQVSNIATAIAGVISATAKAVFAARQQWEEIFSLLVELAQHPEERQRILCFRLIFELVENISDQLKPHSQVMANMFVAGCQDASTAVAKEALSATGYYIMQLGDCEEVMAMKSVVPPMLTALTKCLSNGEDEVVLEVLDVIQESCQLEQPLINDHIDEIVRFTSGILQSKDCEAPVKQAAGHALMVLIEFRPKLFAKRNLVGPVLSALMDMIAKQEASAAGSLFSFTTPEGALDDEDDDDEYDEEGDVNKLAQMLIDTMALKIPSKYFSDTALAMISQGMGSGDAHMRKAGCAVLGVVAEGCSDKIRENLANILPSLLRSVQDPEFYVRECACFALGQFSEYCQPEILHYHQMVLPVVFQALDDSRPTVQGTSCYVLEYFCENLQPETLRPFLTPLMTKLVMLLQSEQKTTREMSLSAIAATAVASEIDFLPYAEAVCGILHQYLFLTEPNQFSIRGRSLECLGHIAIAIGKDNFGRYFEMGMQSATQGLKLDDEDLKEHCFVFVANTVKVMGRDFASCLPQMVPYLLDVVEESEILKLDDEDEEEVDEQEEDEADEDYEDVGDYRLNVMEGFVNSKKAALTALGSIAEHAQELFVPYLDRALQSITVDSIGSLYSLHESIRAESITVLQYFLMSACAHQNMTVPVKGVQQTLSPNIAQLASTIMNICVTALTGDDDKLPVSYACETIDGVLKLIGVAALHLPTTEGTGPVATPLMQAIHTLLLEKAPCQKKSEKVEEDDDDDHDNAVIDSVSDLVAALARELGETFVPYFDQFNSLLLKFAKPNRSHSDRAMAIGCFAEVIKEVGAPSLKYIDTLLPMIHAGLSDPMESVRRNSAYCVGVMVQSTGTALVPHYLTMLQWLHPLCVRSASQMTADTGGADVDNALAAVARMINASPAAVPLAQVLPVFFASLPLRSDTTEGPTVYGCLYTLVQNNNVDAINAGAQLIAVFAEVLSSQSNAVDETKAVCAQALKLVSQHPQLTSLLQTHLNTITDAAWRQSLAAALQ